MLRAAPLLVIIASAPAFSSSAYAAESRVGVSGSVKEVCRFEAAPLVVQDNGDIAVGSAFEACNSFRSFNITANTRSLDTSEALVLGYGSSMIALNGNGRTIVSQNRGPTFRTIDLTLEARQLARPVSLTLSMSAV